MPTAPLALCTEPGCGALVSSGKCDDHRKERRREADNRRPSSKQRGWSYEWSQFSKAYLEQHSHCVSTTHFGQGIPATDVDHIDGTGRNGPRAYDETNLAAYCHSCHSTKTALFDNGFGRPTGDIMPWSPKQKCASPDCSNLVDSGWCTSCQEKNLSETRITVVAGPPAAGKTTYVAEHRGPNDLVVDLDAIAQALGSDVSHDHNQRLLPFMYAARDAILDRISRPNDIDKVWIIRGAPTNRERREWWQAKVIIIATPAAEAKRRAKAAGRPAHWTTLIDQWWNDYQPNPDDLIIQPTKG